MTVPQRHANPDERFMSYLHGKFVWFEHSSADPGAAAGFYAELFGWTVENFDMGGGPYTMIKNGAEGIGGIRCAAKGQPSAWMSYLPVADVDACTKTAQAAGAKLLMPPTDFSSAGRGAALADPTGGVFSVWKSAQGDATLAPALRLGANELVGATDDPNVGRFALVADPTGASIAFINKS